MPTRWSKFAGVLLLLIVALGALAAACGDSGTPTTAGGTADIQGSQKEGDAMAKEEEGDAMVEKEEGDAMMEKEEGDAMVEKNEGDAMVEKEEGDAMVEKNEGDAMVEKEEGDAMMEKKEGDAMMEKKEGDAMMEKKEGDAMMDKEEGDAMMEKKEGDAMMEKKEGDAMMEKKEGDAMMEKKEGDAMMEKKEGDAMMEKKEGDAMMEKKEGDAMMSQGTSLTLDLTGISPLANGYHYEGWVIIDGTPVTTGRFNLNADGRIVDLAGGIVPGGEFAGIEDLSRTTAVVITIEPDGDPDPAPASTHYLAGSVTDGMAALTVGHTAAFGDDFSDASGVYILATPTNDPGGDENSGIWFLDLSSGGPTHGLQLPALPEGWVYEGWVVMGGTPVTTGKFTSPVTADGDAPYSGPSGGPPFPGEDFLANAPEGLMFPTDLAGQMAVISVEPSPDDSGAPFTLKPLVGAIPSGATDHTTYSLENRAGGFPVGVATIN